MPSLDRLALAVAAGLFGPALVTIACGEPAEIPTEATSSVASGLAGAPPSDAGDGGRGGAAGQGGAGGSGSGGAPPTVLVGLAANPLVEGAEVPGQAQRLASAASAYAAGARLATIQRRWRDVDDAGLAADLSLARAGCAPEVPCRPIAFTLALVDGTVDGRPEALQEEPWSGAEAQADLEAAIERVIAAMGSDLAVLTLGARTDRWLEEHEGDAADLGALLQAGADRATALGGDGLLVGVGLSHDAALASEGPGPALRSLGTALTLSLLPGALAPSEPLPASSNVAQILDALAALSPGTPVALVEAGYPASPALGSSEESQAAFLDALFSAIDARRELFPIVVVSRMHDLDEQACAVEGAEIVDEPEDATAYRCSTGLRDHEGLAKIAWESFLAGAAKLASSGVAPGP